MPGDVPPRRVILTVVYDNVPYRDDLRAALGFACVLETPERTVLFDTGEDGELLASNMRGLGFGPGDIDTVFISHKHGDHCGGLMSFLEQNAQVDLYVPRGFLHRYTRPARRMGANVHTLREPGRIGPNLYSTGPFAANEREQSLLVDTEDGLIILTGCSHPGVDRIAWAAREQIGRPVRLVIGGFHLADAPPEEIRRIADELHGAGVEFVAPSHCTGERATELLRETFGDRCVASGLARRVDSGLLGTITGVYAGPGATRADNVVAALGRAGIRHRRLDAGDVQAGDFKGCSLVMMPGGRTAEMLDGLGDEGLQNIRNFVLNGGGYVGICAGAYLAAPRVEIPGRPPGLALLDIENRRGTGQGERTITMVSADHPLAEDCPTALRLWWENGPAIGASENVQVVARYADGTAAIACGQYGEGSVVLFGPHPEGRTGEAGEAGEPGAADLLRNAVAFAGGHAAKLSGARER